MTTTGVQLRVVDDLDVTGPPARAVAVVEAWAQTLAATAPGAHTAQRCCRSWPSTARSPRPAAVAAWRDAQAARGLGHATIR
jgi:hypothetical protein